MARKKCVHERDPYTCKQCGGKGICKHNRRRSQCQDCKGKSICKHKRQRWGCKDCGGKGVCKHGRLRYTCKMCGGFPTLAQEMWRRAKERAKRDDLSFNISVKDVLELIGDGFCPIFGTPFGLNSRRVTDTSANLDRFINGLGYTKENCAVISMLANSMKRNATTDQVLKLWIWMKQRQDAYNDKNKKKT